MKLKAITPENLQKAYDEGCSDVKKVLENLHPDYFEKEETYKQGDRLMYDGDEYIVASCESDKVVAISLRNGNRYCNPVTVDDDEAITIEEMNKILSGDFKAFKKV